MILILIAALSPSVLWRTLRCGLPADMILQKRPIRFAKNNNPKIFLLGHKKMDIITAVKKTFPKIQTENIKLWSQKKNTTTNSLNTTDITHMHLIISTTFLNKSIF
jgi:hypothetical protein